MSTHFLHNEHIYIDVNTSRCHNTCSLYRYITGTSLDTPQMTPQMTSLLEQYFRHHGHMENTTHSG